MSPPPPPASRPSQKGVEKVEWKNMRNNLCFHGWATCPPNDSKVIGVVPFSLKCVMFACWYRLRDVKQKQIEGNLSKTVTIVYFRFVCEKNQCHALVHASVDANMYNRMNRPGNVDDSFVEVCVCVWGGGGGKKTF